MARYDIVPAWFKTPRGRAALIYIREGTNDWNSANASMSEDEYGLRDLHLTGHVVDIGGYLGTVAIGILLDNPGTTATILEPLPENAALIRRNADANGVADRLTVLEAAAGDGTPVTVHYAYTGNENDLHHAFVGNSTISGEVGAPHKSVTVPSMTPDDFYGATFVKIDCENGEWPFFASAPARFPLIVGERHPFEGRTREDFCALLPDYDVTFTGPEEGPDEFRAVLRA